jgi:hypothetical protein
MGVIEMSLEARHCAKENFEGIWEGC